MSKKIVVLEGDGIGHEVVPQALRIFEYVKDKYQIIAEIELGPIGGAAYELHGKHFPDVTKALCETADAVLFGSVGGPVAEAHLEKWVDCEKNSILALRKLFHLNANLRPIRVYPELMEKSPLKNSLVEKGIDILVVRELIGDIYFGEHKRYKSGGFRHAHDIAEYDENQIRIATTFAFNIAKTRCHKVTSVDKANVLDVSKLWREVTAEVGKDYPDVQLENMLVDNCALQLVLNPSQFDVIVTTNLFGDILSDLGAALPGTLGLMPSASLNVDGFGLYEPAGGSAPDIAGKNIANPVAQILSVAMMMRYTFQHEKAATAIEAAVRSALQAGFRTRDIFTEGDTLVGTEQMTSHILEFLKKD